MNTVSLALVGALVLGLSAAARADEGKGDTPDTKKMLVGKWEVVKFTGEKGGPPPGAAIEFTKDGKVILTADKDGEQIRREATYKVEGKGLTLTRKRGDTEEAQRLQVVKLDGKELILRHEKDGGELTLKRKGP